MLSLFAQSIYFYFCKKCNVLKYFVIIFHINDVGGTVQFIVTIALYSCGGGDEV